MYLNTLKGFIEQPEWLGSGGSAIPEGNWDYDVVVIGGGPGGEDCARELAEHGVKVAMINDAPLRVANACGGVAFRPKHGAPQRIVCATAATMGT